MPTSSDWRTATRAKLRRRIDAAVADPTAFAAFAFADGHGRPLRLAAVHRELQAFLSAHPFALVELPRDHGKSVQLCARVLWELGHRPGLRVKLVCATEALAAERGRFIRDAIALNPAVRLVFPRLRPAKPWEAVRFTVRRPNDVIGPSVAAFGVGAGSTGARADLLVCDDIVDVKALASRAERQRVKAYFRENLLNLLEPDGRAWCAFTPWHPDDLNHELKANAAFALLRRPVGDDLQPVWPEQWPRERLLERRLAIGETAFARAYRLVCDAGEDAVIRRDWLRTWAEPADWEIVILAVDPAVSQAARADASALVVLAKTVTGEVRCLEATARRASASELMELIADAEARWQPQAIVFEANAAFRGLCELLQRHPRFGAKVRSVVQSVDKYSRVQAFGVMVESGVFRVKGNGTGVDAAQQALADEMTTFPHGRHDDLLDAAAFGTAWLMHRREPRAW